MLLLLLVPVGLALAVLGSDAGRQAIARAIERAASTPGEAEVRLGRLDGDLLGSFVLDTVSVADADGAWLRLDDVRVDWSPWALLGGTLAIESVAVDRIAVSRPPAPTAATAADTPAALPDLPLDVAVRKLMLARIELGEAVLGQAAVFAVDGEIAGTPPQTVAARLDVTRLDGVAGTVAARATLRGDDRHLSLSVQAHEPAGGLLARLLELPDLPTLDAGLVGEGSLDDWRGQATLALPGLYRADAKLRLRGFALTVDGTGTAERDFVEPPWALLNGAMSVTLAAAWDPDAEVAQLGSFEAAGAAWRARATGRYAVDPGEGEVAAGFTITDAEALAPLAAGVWAPGLDVALSARGGLDTFAATVRVTAPDVRQGDIAAGDVTAEIELAGPLAGPFDIAGAGRVGALTVPGAPPAYLAGGIDWSLKTRADMAGQQVRLDAFAVTTALAEVAGSGDLALATGDIAADLVVTVPDLSPLAPLDGQARFQIAALAGAFGEYFAADVDGRIDATSPDPALAAALSGGATLAARLSGGLDGVLDLERLTVATSTVSASATGGLDENFSRLRAGYRVDVPSLAPFAAVTGGARVEGTAAGALDNLAANGRVILSDIAVETLAVPAATVDYRLTGLPAAPRGDIDASAQTTFGAVSARTTLTMAADHLRLADIDVTVADAGRIAGDLRLPLAGTAVAGALTAEAAALKPFLAFAGLMGSGRARADIQLADLAGRQGASIDARIDDLKLELDGQEVAVAAMTLQVTNADVEQRTVEALALRVANAALGADRLDSIAVDAAGAAARMSVTVAVEGDVRGRLALNARAEVAANETGLAATVASFEGEALGESLALNQPLKLQQAPGALAVQGLDLRVGPARLAGDASIGRDAVAIDLRMSDLDLSKLRRQAGLAGRIDGAIQVSGVGAAQRGSLRLTAADVGLADLPDAGPAAADIQGTLDGGRMRLKGEIGGVSTTPLIFAGNLPLAIGGGQLVALAPDLPIAGDVAWQGEIGEIWPFMPLPTHLLTGQGSLKASVSGTLAAPRLAGAAGLSQGRYESLEAGTIVSNLDIRVVLAGDKVVLEQFSGDDGSGGSLNAEGNVQLPDNDQLQALLRGTLANFTLLRRDDIVASLGGEAEVTVAGTRGQVTGRFRTEIVEVLIPDRLPLQVAELDVVDAAAPPEPDRAPQPTLVADLDIQVELPGRVYVRGRGLDSEWQGQVQVTGTSAEPEIAGELTIVRGNLGLLSKDFQLTEGRVVLPGGPEPDPQIAVTATHQASDLEVVVRVTGPATNPDFTLTSVPGLPQDEIVARLFFNKNAAQLSALEAAQLAAAIGELTGVTSGPGLIDRLRNSLGVDVLRVETADDGSTAVSAGTYVSEGVLVGVQQGAAVGSGAVSVEVEVTPHISVESKVKQTGASSVGAKVKWDY
ncbi:MAG: translocation/assembly module TamB domain-containing protein [Alphaproteobacteria bacterium]